MEVNMCLTNDQRYGMWDIGNEILLKQARMLLRKQREKKEIFICYSCRQPRTGKKFHPYWYKKTNNANVCEVCYNRILKKHENYK